MFGVDYSQILFVIMHLVIILYTIVYILIPKPGIRWDVVYMVCSLLLLLSWYIFRGECAISYYDKQRTSTRYKMGEDVMNISDIQSLVPFLNEEQIKRFFDALQIWRAISLLIIQQRSHILPDILFYVFLWMYIIYIVYLRHFYNETFFNRVKLEKSVEEYLRGMCIIYLIVCLGLILSKKKLI